MIPFSVDGIDVALQPVVAIVKIRNHQVEPFNHGFANRVDVIGVAHKDKIIPAHVADKPFYSGELTDDRRENATSHYQHLVTTAVSIPVIERLEIVDIKVSQREGLAALNAGRGFE